MYRIANESKENRRIIFINTGRKKNMNPAIIEKDFWVCFLLELLFHQSNYGNHFSFKGGTSLSKGYGVIERFSEDIDLVMDWRLVGYSKDEPWLERSNTKQDLFNKEIDRKTAEFLKETIMPYFSNWIQKYIEEPCEFYILESDPQTIRFIYPQLFHDDVILEEIRLEIGTLGAWTPATSKVINPYAAEEYPNIFKNSNTVIRMVEAKRTFWEKATILHREANRTNGKLPDRYSRHYYDMYMLSQTSIKEEAFKDQELLKKVIRFKEKFYRSSWAKYEEATQKKIKLVPPKEIILSLKKDYVKMQEMIYGERISFDEIIAGLKQLEEEIYDYLNG
jgi:predicted nucleotidyltransferase component of viral defense system